MSSKRSRRSSKSKEESSSKLTRKAENAVSKRVAPTVEEIVEDPLTLIALQYWTKNESATPKKYDPKIIEKIYDEELTPSHDAKEASIRPRVVMLELGRYLENYLWPNFDAKKATKAHLLSLFLLINQKYLENVDPWEAFADAPDRFSLFFERALHLREEKSLSYRERTIFTVFLINTFQSFGSVLVRNECMKLTTLLTWHEVSERKREALFEEVPKLKKFWRILNKKPSSKGKKKSKAFPQRDLDKQFIPNLVKDFLATLESLDLSVDIDKDAITYLERSVELFTDILSQLTTRRFLGVVFQDLRLLVRARRSELYSSPHGKLFKKLVDIHAFYVRFEIDDFSGETLRDDLMEVAHYKRMQTLQRAAFHDYKDQLKSFALANVRSVDSREALTEHLSPLTKEKLTALCQRINIPVSEDKSLMLESIIASHERRESQLHTLNKQALFPDENLLWDPDQVPESHRISDTCLALPKLNIQFLTFHDYFLRNFTLFRLESTYEIRLAIEDCVRRLQARASRRGDGVVDVSFGGWSRNAVRIDSLTVTDVQPPKVGYTVPSKVLAEINFVLPQPNIGQRDEIQKEWDSLRQHDAVFLLSIRPPTQQEMDKMSEHERDNLPFPKRYGVAQVRGATVSELVDDEGQVLSDPNPHTKPRYSKGSRRVLKLELDPAQYQLDLKESPEGSEHPSSHNSINVLLKRKAKENNFKSVLETIRDLMNADVKFPEWLHDVFLGYGDPKQAVNTTTVPTIDFHDTFISSEHVQQSFPDYEVQFVGEERSPPYKLTFPEEDKTPIKVQAYIPPPPGPYPQDLPKRNSIPFTPIQVDSIKRSMNEGLTMIVGPPGTGKTDVAVQVVSNLYHTFPTQRTLIITHSNQALNQIFEKLAVLEIDQRHLLRLGHGSSELAVDSDYSKFGRVNYMLRLRLELLEQVSKLAETIDIPIDVAYTAETSGNFRTYHVLSKWEKFLKGVEIARSLPKEQREKWISLNFPFTKFFSDIDGLFSNSDFEKDLQFAIGCWNHIDRIFTRLADCRAFELLKSWNDRGNYLLMAQAKVVAMTCTHAALKRRELLDFGFKYDNIIMEEAAQVLEIETFIPMLLQNQDPEAPPRLKRVVLIGDHNQLPPVIQNQAIQSYSKLDQSLFARFIRLGVPFLQLDNQGRARPSIAELYSWRYDNLGNLPHVADKDEFKLANAGFLLDYQMINVEDYLGRGEMTPSAYFYQNLGEAEYVVAMFMYMRMIGYPAEKITILTSYNGQKHLIRDVIEQRCAQHPQYGKPHKITTVDRYQGQQNDYVLLSLVRTRNVGHIRDVRRLVVAMSRARLGLYVFCRRNLFENCYELTPVFSKLRALPDKLQLVQNEQYPTTRKLGEQPKSFEVRDLMHMGQIVGSTM